MVCILLKRRTRSDVRTKDQTPQAIMFWEPPTTMSPRAANCWTAFRMLVTLGPKHRLVLRLAWRSISAVRRITSYVSGGDFYAFDLQLWKTDFWLVVKSASNSETAWARRTSGLSREAVLRARAIDDFSQQENLVKGWRKWPYMVRFWWGVKGQPSITRFWHLSLPPTRIFDAALRLN